MILFGRFPRELTEDPTVLITNLEVNRSGVFGFLSFSPNFMCMQRVNHCCVPFHCNCLGECRWGGSVPFRWKVVSGLPNEDIMEKGLYPAGSCGRDYLDVSYLHCIVISPLVLPVFFCFLFRYRPSYTLTYIKVSYLLWVYLLASHGKTNARLKQCDISKFILSCYIVNIIPKLQPFKLNG